MGKFMKNFIYNVWKKFQYSLFFSCCVITIFAMDERCAIPIVSNKNYFLPQKKQTIFRPKEALAKRLEWDECVPASIVITPDGKGVVLGNVHGAVQHLSFSDMFHSKPEQLFEHPRVRHSPMIAMVQVAEQKDSSLSLSPSLLLVSAGNYFDSEKARYVSECIVFRKGMPFDVRKLDFCIQAIDLNSTGEMLAIVGQNSVGRHELLVIDLKNNAQDKWSYPSYAKNSTDPNDYIVDVSFGFDNEGNEGIVVAGHQGWAELIFLMRKGSKGHDINAVSRKKVSINDAIQKIYYGNKKNAANLELLCLTLAGKSKKIDMSQCNKDDLPVKVNSCTFAYSKKNDSIAVDRGSQFIAAYWTKHINVPESVRRTIKVYRKSEDCIEKFILQIGALDQDYYYVTKQHRLAQGIGHVMLVALRGNKVVALGTDGEMHLWTLPEKMHVRHEVTKVQEIANKGVPCKDRLVRRRSNTFPGRENDKATSCPEKLAKNPVSKLKEEVTPKRKGSLPGAHKDHKPRVTSSMPSPIVHSDTQDKKQKKTSPQFMGVLTHLKSSRDSSPVHLSKSKESSPINSPRDYERIDTKVIFDALENLKQFD
jgi:hypothetical protein